MIERVRKATIANYIVESKRNRTEKDRYKMVYVDKTEGIAKIDLDSPPKAAVEEG